MYSNKLVCSVKVGRKILREKVRDNESTVFIPFGSEYSLMLKNLGGRNAVVYIEIDGKKVSQNGFYIRAGQTADIERFVESLVEGRRFKFIEKTEEISDFRGDKVDDGIVRVTWQFEKAAPEIKDVIINHHHDHFNAYQHGWGCGCPFCRPNNIWYGPSWSNTSIPMNNITYTSSIGSSISGGGGSQSSCFNANSFNANIVGSNVDAVCGAMGPSGPKGNDSPEGSLYRSMDAPGITVEGSQSFQQFEAAHASMLETNVHSMVILLRGVTTEHTYVAAPITVEYKKQCSSCGRRWKNMEFCPKCGTALK